jgi:2-oxoglutarate ferredoxin oxidoreductase subunit beta
VVEILTQCPTYFGRKNRMGTAVDMLNWYKDNTTPIGSKAKQENPDLIERGIFVQKETARILCRVRKGRRNGQKGT